MRYDDKLKVCRRTAIWIAVLSLADVLGMEWGIIPKESGDRVLTVFIVLRAVALGVNFVLKWRDK